MAIRTAADRTTTGVPSRHGFRPLARVATKADLERLRDNLCLDIRTDLAEKLNDVQRNLFLGLVTAQATIGALVLAAVG